MGYYTGNSGLIGPGVINTPTGVHDIIANKLSNAAYPIVSGTGTLFKGSTSTGTASSGWTTVQSTNRDDGYQSIPLGFFWTINNTQYSTVYVGSNNYITFGSGQTQYSGYNFSTWNIPKILYTMTSDNSYQYVTYKQFTDYTRIRFEGNSSTSGTVGSGNIVWETTFFNPTAVGNISLVEIRCGSNGRGTQYTMGIAGPSSTTAYASHSSLVNQSVVYVGNSVGNIYTANVGSYVNYAVGL